MIFNKSTAKKTAEVLLQINAISPDAKAEHEKSDFQALPFASKKGVHLPQEVRHKKQNP